MKKKSIEWVLLVLSVGLLGFSIFGLVNGINKDSKHYFNSLEININIGYADMNVQHDYIDTIINAYKNKEELQELLFNPSSMASDESISGPELMRIQTLLGLGNDTSDIYGYGYYYNRKDIYQTGTTVSILNVTEESSYRYQAYFPEDSPEIPVGGFWWVLADSNGNELFHYDDFRSSFQDKITLEKGVYFLYYDFDNLPNGIEITLEFN